MEGIHHSFRPEQTPPPRRAEVTARPLGENLTLEQKIRTNQTNAAIAAGGVAFNNRGQPIEIEGIAGQALESIDQELVDFDERHNFFQAEIEQNTPPQRGSGRWFGWLRRSPKPEAIAEKDIKAKSKEHKKEREALQKEVIARRKEINKLLDEHRLSGEVIGIWHNLVDLEKYLRENPDTEDFDPIEPQLVSLNFDLLDPNLLNQALTQGLTRNMYLKLLVDGTVITSPGFSEYMGLRLGKGYSHKGMDQLEEELDEKIQTQNMEIGQLHKPLTRSKEMNRLLAQDRITLSLAETKRAEIARDADAVSRAEAFIKDRFLVKEEEITPIVEDIARFTDRKNQLTQELTTATGERKQEIEKEIQVVDSQLRMRQHHQEIIFHPMKRLEGAPPELKAALELVNQPGFRLDQIPDKQRRVILLGSRDKNHQTDSSNWLWRTLRKNTTLEHIKPESNTYITALVKMAAALLGKDQSQVHEKDSIPENLIIDEQTNSAELTELATTEPKQLVQAMLKGVINVEEFLESYCPTDNNSPVHTNPLQFAAYPIDQIKQMLKEKKQTEGLSDETLTLYIYQLILTSSKYIYDVLLEKNPNIRANTITLTDQQRLKQLCLDLNIDPDNINALISISSLIKKLLYSVGEVNLHKALQP